MNSMLFTSSQLSPQFFSAFSSFCLIYNILQMIISLRCLFHPIWGNPRYKKWPHCPVCCQRPIFAPLSSMSFNGPSSAPSLLFSLIFTYFHSAHYFPSGPSCKSPAWFFAPGPKAKTGKMMIIMTVIILNLMGSWHCHRHRHRDSNDVKSHG